MSERFENSNLLNQNLAEDTWGAALRREADLLGTGLTRGATQRLTEMKDNLPDTLANAAACFGLGAALNIASRAGGRWGMAAKVIGGVFLVGGAIDIGRRAAPTLGAIGDTWNSADNLEQNKETVARYAGTAVVDYPFMLLTGYAGFKAGGFTSRPAQFTINEITPRAKDLMLDSPGIGRKANLLEAPGGPGKNSPLKLDSPIQPNVSPQLNETLSKPVFDGKAPAELPANFNSPALKDVGALKDLIPHNQPLPEGLRIPAENSPTTKSELFVKDRLPRFDNGGKAPFNNGGKGPFDNGFGPGTTGGFPGGPELVPVPWGQRPLYVAVAEMGGPAKVMKLPAQGFGGSGGGFGKPGRPPGFGDGALNNQGAKFGDSQFNLDPAQLMLFQNRPLPKLFNMAEVRPLFIPAILPLDVLERNRAELTKSATIGDAVKASWTVRRS